MQLIIIKHISTAALFKCGFCIIVRVVFGVGPLPGFICFRNISHLNV